MFSRVRAELSADFLPGNPVRVSRAPASLDTFGGIAEYTGSLVCQFPLDRAASVVLQSRSDRAVQVLSFNQLDENRPFTLRISLDALAKTPIDRLRADFQDPSRHWAASIVGCLAILHDQKLVDLADPLLQGINIALLSTVPEIAGVGASAAIEVATIINLIDHFNLRPALARSDDKPESTALARLCQMVQTQVVGEQSEIAYSISSAAAEAGALVRILCQPHELQMPLHLPAGIRVIGINSNIKPNPTGDMYDITRCAAFMAQKIIFEKMRDMGSAAGLELQTDPMKGYLANLPPADYKHYFRPFLPENMPGQDFIDKFGSNRDSTTQVDPATFYHVQNAADHHVLEAMRVRNFVDFLQQAAPLPVDRPRGLLLDKAGHLMYASHMSCKLDALLGADECDLLVDLARSREPAGIYGAKITGRGRGGTIAVLADVGEKVDRAIDDILKTYHQRTGLEAQAFLTSSPGAWTLGTRLISI